MSALNEPTIATDELRPTRIEVDLDVLAENYGAIAAHVAPARVMPILKANAYGHGLVEVGRVVERLRAPYIGVAYLEEGLRLRQHGVRLPVLVLGGILGSQIPRFLEHDITLTASSVDKLRAIEEHAVRVGRTATVHLKIDTGMERIGVHWYSAETLLEESLRCRHLRVEGIFTHFANADARDLGHARLQLERFHEVLRFYERRSLPPPLRHAANSGAIVQLRESHLDLVRPGILFDGARPAPPRPRSRRSPAGPEPSRTKFSPASTPACRESTAAARRDLAAEEPQPLPPSHEPPTTVRPQARAAVASATSWVAITMSLPLCSRQSSAVARWIASSVPSSVGGGWAARASTGAVTSTTSRLSRSLNTVCRRRATSRSDRPARERRRSRVRRHSVSANALATPVRTAVHSLSEPGWRSTFRRRIVESRYAITARAAAPRRAARRCPP